MAGSAFFFLSFWRIQAIIFSIGGWLVTTDCIITCEEEISVEAAKSTAFAVAARQGRS